MSFKVVGIGEVLWDLLPSGPQLGGAPANFACHARALGASSSVVTRVGNDPLGHEIFARFKEMDLPTHTIQVDDNSPTGTVPVTLNANGVPHFMIRENVAWDQLVFTDAAFQSVQEADAVCFGTLAQRSKSASAVIQKLIAATPQKCLRVLDINLRQNFYTKEIIEKSLELVNVLKLNDQELPVLAKMFDLNGAAEQQIQRLAVQFGLKIIALTRGSNGSLLYQSGNWSDRPGNAIQIVDTVGAGDSFTAGLVMGLLGGMNLCDINRVAAEIAGFVCSRQGATPSLPIEYKEKFITQNFKVNTAKSNAITGEPRLAV